MDWFKLIYTLVGGLGIFLFGMKGLSEGLQSVASSFIRKAINMITKNRVFAVLMGVVITSFVQSSSVSTVMMVGMVNAGLMNLTQAIGFIFGANIGTTITGWIISIKVGKYGLLLIGMGIFPMLFSKHDRLINIGKLLFSLGLIFFGLELMGNAFKPLRTNTEFISYLTIYSTAKWYGLLTCFAIGCALTMIIQSSSAMLGITIALATQGVINFETAAALVLGENIGTTITIWLASIGANKVSKRAALSHTFFNVFGVFLAFLIFKPYVHFVDMLVAGDPTLAAANQTHPNVAIHIAAVHTIFNIGMTVLFVPFLTYLKNLVTFIFPDKTGEREKLTYFDGAVNISPELAINEAHLQLIRMGELVNEALIKTRDYLKSEEPSLKTYNIVNNNEKTIDHMQYEITVFLSHVMQAHLLHIQSNRINAMIKVCDEMESVSDYCQSIVNYRMRIEDKGGTLDENIRTVLFEFMIKVEKFYFEIFQHVANLDKFKIKPIIKKYIELNKEADEIKEHHLKYVVEYKSNPIFGLTFSDIMIALRRIKNHSLNIAEALTGDKGLN